MVTRVIAALRTRARAGLHYPCDEATRREGLGHQATTRGDQTRLGDQVRVSEEVVASSNFE